MIQNGDVNGKYIASAAAVLGCPILTDVALSFFGARFAIVDADEVASLAIGRHRVAIFTFLASGGLVLGGFSVRRCEACLTLVDFQLAILDFTLAGETCRRIISIANLTPIDLIVYRRGTS